ncbi:hypothetical protein KJ605_02895 [Patescibacteria group bacterium]|nr:hypothetical protein [Patescibacteria group bacterium]
MKVGLLRITLIRALLFSANCLALLESRFFGLVLKFAFVTSLVGLCFVYRAKVSAVALVVQSNITTLVWYRTLPADYWTKLDQESQVVVERYRAALKPKSPQKVAELPSPAVSAKSYLVLDVLSDTVLSSKNADLTVPPASTAKLATALASLKLYRLDEELTVPQFCTQVDGTKADLVQGQKFLVGDLLKALLVFSAGDAGCTLSIGKSSYADFVGLMNTVAQEANMQHTKFTNPIGLDDVDGQNLSSAADLARLGVAAEQNPFIREVTRLKDFGLTDLESTYARQLANTNKLLLEIPETVGIKTGTTTGAGEVLIYEYQKDQVDLIIVVMGSADRFADTKAILAWTLESYVWAN